MNALLTGSQIYGTPREDSDIDLVVLVADGTADALWKLGEPGPSGRSVLFGKLNLIVETDPLKFEAWRAGTAALIERKPVSRDEAVEHFKVLFEALRATQETVP